MAVSLSKVRKRPLQKYEKNFNGYDLEEILLSLQSISSTQKSPTSTLRIGTKTTIPLLNEKKNKPALHSHD